MLKNMKIHFNQKNAEWNALGIEAVPIFLSVFGSRGCIVPVCDCTYCLQTTTKTTKSEKMSEYGEVEYLDEEQESNTASKHPDELMLDCIQNFPCLFDISDRTNKNNNLKENAFKAVAEACGKTGRYLL